MIFLFFSVFSFLFLLNISNQHWLRWFCVSQQRSHNRSFFLKKNHKMQTAKKRGRGYPALQFPWRYIYTWHAENKPQEHILTLQKRETGSVGLVQTYSISTIHTRKKTAYKSDNSYSHQIQANKADCQRAHMHSTCKYRTQQEGTRMLAIARQEQGKHE